MPIPRDPTNKAGGGCPPISSPLSLPAHLSPAWARFKRKWISHRQTHGMQTCSAFCFIKRRGSRADMWVALVFTSFPLRTWVSYPPPQVQVLHTHECHPRQGPGYANSPERLPLPQLAMEFSCCQLFLAQRMDWGELNIPTLGRCVLFSRCFPVIGKGRFSEAVR